MKAQIVFNEYERIRRLQENLDINNPLRIVNEREEIINGQIIGFWVLHDGQSVTTSAPAVRYVLYIAPVKSVQRASCFDSYGVVRDDGNFNYKVSIKREELPIPNGSSVRDLLDMVETFFKAESFEV